MVIRSRSVSFCLAVCLAGCLSGCMSGQQSVAVDVDPTGWDNWVTLTYENPDTLGSKDISLSLRYNAGASPRIGTYYVGTGAPSGALTEDELQVTLDPVTDNGLQEARVLLRKGALLAESGRYVFTVKPARPTVGVWSVALEFRPTETGVSSTGRRRSNRER